MEPIELKELFVLLLEFEYIEDEFEGITFIFPFTLFLFLSFFV